MDGVSRQERKGLQGLYIVIIWPYQVCKDRRKIGRNLAFLGALRGNSRRIPSSKRRTQRKMATTGVSLFVLLVKKLSSVSVKVFWLPVKRAQPMEA